MRLNIGIREMFGLDVGRNFRVHIALKKDLTEGTPI
jgi:hypothetical protein